MRAAGEQAVQDSAERFKSPAATNEQPAAPIVSGERGHPRSAPSPVYSAAGGSTMDQDPEIEVKYSGESNSPPDSQPCAKPDRKFAGSTTDAPRGSIDKDLRHEMFGSSDESMNSASRLN